MHDTLAGLSLIGAERGAAGGPTFHGIDPANGETLRPLYHSARAEDAERAVALAQAAGRARATSLAVMGRTPPSAADR